MAWVSRGELPYLVEEEGAAVCLLEITLAGGYGACERTLFVTEKFGIDGPDGDCAAVDRQERGGTASAAVVDDARDHVFTRTVLAGDKHGKIARSHDARHLDRKIEGGVVTDDVVSVFDPL